jgi:alkaline phosphatase
MQRLNLVLVLSFFLILISCKPKPVRDNINPKNIILFIGDGMGLAQVYASMTRSDHELNLEKFPVIGLVKTYSSDNYITDSGAGATAYSAGIKTKNGSLGVDSLGHNVGLITEQAKTHGLATGLVVTCSLTHATPAGFVAHVVSRDSDEMIAKYYLHNTIDVAIGGGKKYFTQRKDHANLLDSLRNSGYAILTSIDSINTSDPKMFCFYADEHPLPISKGRGDALARSVKKAVEILSKNKNGFFLMVEGSQIDWGGHANDIDYVVSEMLDMDQALENAVKFAETSENTLVLVTADHETGGLSIIGGDLKKREIQAAFSTKGHSAIMVPLYAFGPGSTQFGGIYQNTDVYKKIKKALKLD